MTDQNSHKTYLSAICTSSSSSLEQQKAVLINLESRLGSFPENKSLKTWLRQIRELINISSTRVVIGVVGATGSGKSSIINALLGEKQLIPTSCMRACTAVVTEISFNFRTNGDPWRAEIEFISEEEWRKELTLLLDDVNTAVNAITDDDSEAGIAFAKITAVYADVDKRNIAKTCIDELMHKNGTLSYLGKKKELEAETSEKLYNMLKKYIDSQEKLNADHTAKSLHMLAKKNAVGYWPLIKRVSIFGKRKVLETGCVLVDLPGIEDSNPARAAVAQKYLKDCAALWIVAPIIRAPDDKPARYLLDERFRRQLHRDGTINRITIICSKTDEINIQEARPRLTSNTKFIKDISIIDNTRAQVEKDRDDLVKSLSQARGDFNDTTERHQKLFREEKAYISLRKLAATGQVVYPPLLAALKPGKRLNEDSEDPQTPKKRSKIDQYLDRASRPSGGRPTLPATSHVAFTSSNRSNSNSVVQDKTKGSLTLSEVECKVQKLALERSKVHVDNQTAKEKIDMYSRELIELEIVGRELSVREWAICVRGRNEYSKTIMKADFAAGLRDLARKVVEGEEEVEIQEHDSNETSDIQSAIDLPIFCVSAQGYQKIHGRLEGEQSAACFSVEADTGIPALQAHVFKLGKDQLLADEDAFLNNASRLLTSFRLWCSGPGEYKPPGSGEAQTKSLDNAIEEFFKELGIVFATTFSDIEECVKKQIFNNLAIASLAGSQNAMLTVNKWVASSRASVNPGIHFNTFQAIVRRNGVYSNQRKSYNFNRDLLEPFMGIVDSCWTPVFQKTLGLHFESSLEKVGQKVNYFTKIFETILINNGASEMAKQIFVDQVSRYHRSVIGILLTARGSIDTRQKDANRLFAFSVRTDMKPIYASLAQETGTGAYSRMKDRLRHHICYRGCSMFDQAASSVRKELEEMLVTIKVTFERELVKLFHGFQQDCIQIVSTTAEEFMTMNRADQDLILAALAQAEASFQTIKIPTTEDNVADPSLQSGGDEYPGSEADVNDAAVSSEEASVKDESDDESNWMEEIETESVDD